MESEVDQISQAIQAHMINTALNSALILNFKSEVGDVLTIDLIGDEAIIHNPPLGGNIADDPEDNLKASTVAPGHSTYRHVVCDESFLSVEHSHMGSTGTPAVPSTSGLQGILTSSLIIDTKTFSPKSMDRVKALMSKENRAHTLITAGAEEAATCFDVPTSQDEESYDGDVSRVDEEDAEVVPDEEDDTQIETLRSAGDNMLQDNEG